MGLLMSALSEAVHAARRRAEKVEATLRESEEQLRRQARALAAADERKNEFLAMLAHELRNPAGADTERGRIMRARPDRERGERVREVIDRQVRHMARLLDDLLDVSRITQGEDRTAKEPWRWTRLWRRRWR
jgi:signal transduction histidine kinase